tara:strand:- start:93 stop:323 length:231 start_codon:yes stop_codon:yes gene_type:complete
MKKFSNEYYLILSVALAFEMLATLAYTSNIENTVGVIFTVMGLAVYCLTFAMGRSKYRKYSYTGNSKRVKESTGSN